MSLSAKEVKANVAMSGGSNSNRVIANCSSVRNEMVLTPASSSKETEQDNQKLEKKDTTKTDAMKRDEEEEKMLPKGKKIHEGNVGFSFMEEAPCVAGIKTSRRAGAGDPPTETALINDDSSFGAEEMEEDEAPALPEANVWIKDSMIRVSHASSFGAEEMEEDEPPKMPDPEVLTDKQGKPRMTRGKWVKKKMTVTDVVAGDGEWTDKDCRTTSFSSFGAEEVRDDTPSRIPHGLDALPEKERKAAARRNIITKFAPPPRPMSSPGMPSRSSTRRNLNSHRYKKKPFGVEESPEDKPHHHYLQGDESLACKAKGGNNKKAGLDHDTRPFEPDDFKHGFLDHIRNTNAPPRNTHSVTASLAGNNVVPQNINEELSDDDEVRPGAQWIYERDNDGGDEYDELGTTEVPTNSSPVDSGMETADATTYSARLVLDIPVAEPYTLTDTELQQQIVEIEQDIRSRRQKIRQNMALLVLFGVVLAAILGGTLGTQLNRDKNAQGQQPTSPPVLTKSTNTPSIRMIPSASFSPSWNPSQSPLPSAPPSSALEARLAARIQSVKPAISFIDPRAAQSRALQWLIQDPYTIETPLTDALLVQRFVLVAFAFATNFASWTGNAGWLVPLDECKWFQVGCGQTSNEVERITLEIFGLSGSLPSEIGLLTNLRRLSLFWNNLSGEIPAEMGELTALTWLSLRNNSFVGSIVTELSRLTLLEVLYLNENRLSGSIPTAMGSLSRLTNLRLDGNSLTGSVPAQVLGRTTDLLSLDISRNQLSSTLPTELGFLTKLTILNMHTNNFRGHIPTIIGRLQNMLVLSFSSNALSGVIPSELGLLSKLVALNMQTNNLRGHIPTILGHLRNLEALSFARNALSDEVPTELGLLTKLTFLNGHSNNLRGHIPTILGHLRDLKLLSFSFNALVGEMPTELALLTKLTALDMSENKLTGHIPATLGRLPELEVLEFSVNALSGKVPTELGLLTKLTWLNLILNYLEGPIPTVFDQATDLVVLALGGNMFSGVLPSELGSLVMLSALVLPFNNLEGPVPTQIALLTNLDVLKLFGNNLSGSIPLSLCSFVLPVIDCGEILCKCCLDRNNRICT